jgi:hypothetical protein
VRGNWNHSEDVVIFTREVRTSAEKPALPRPEAGF